MSEYSAVETAPFAGRPGAYELSSDLSKLCLPSEFQEPQRKLAWVDSICFLFLVIGLVGIKAQKVVERPLTQVAEVRVEIYTPPEEQPKIQPEIKPDEMQPQET